MLIASSQVKIRFFISLSPLIRPQGFHRLEFRCFCRRVAAEQHAQRHGKAEGRQRHPSGGENGHLEQNLAQSQTADGAEDNAYNAAHAAEHTGFDEELGHDAAALRAKDSVMTTVTALREGAEDVYADAKAINERRAEAEAAAVVEDTSAEESKAE